MSDERLIALAALAFLSWRDTGAYPSLMGAEIDSDELAAALDRFEDRRLLEKDSDHGLS